MKEEKKRDKNFDGDLELKRILNQITNGYTRQLIRNMMEAKYTSVELKARLNAYKQNLAYAKTITEKLDIKSTIKAINQLMGYVKRKESDGIRKYQKEHRRSEDVERLEASTSYDESISKCSNCGSSNLERDEFHAETVCRDCGMVNDSI